MRGAAFIGGEGPEADIGRRTLEAIDIVVAADSGLVAVEAWGLEPDWIVGDMDSLDDRSRLDRYPQEHILTYPVDKDYTDTELAIELLLKKGCDEIVIVGGGGGRLDHTLAIAALFERKDTPKRWITAREDVRFLNAGEDAAFLQARLPVDALISVFPVGSGPWKATSLGLKWPLDDLTWSRGFFGISNMASEGGFSISALSGRFLVMLPLV